MILHVSMRTASGRRPTMPLTPRQREVLDAIIDFITDKGYPPSVRDLQSLLKIASPNGVVCHLTALEKKGMIERDAMRSRGIRLLCST